MSRREREDTVASSSRWWYVVSSIMVIVAVIMVALVNALWANSDVAVVQAANAGFVIITGSAAAMVAINTKGNGGSGGGKA